MEKLCGIYCLTNKINGKKYIGQSVDIKRRLSEHYYKPNNQVVSQAIKKYGRENFIMDVVELCDETELDKLEIKYIKEHNTHVSNGLGYNVDNGGKGSGKVSEETKRKISEASSGEKNGFFGRTHTEEVKEKIKEHHKTNPNYSFHGKKHTGKRNEDLRKLNMENDFNNRGKGVLYYTDKSGLLKTQFAGKTKSVTPSKYGDLAKPLIIMERLCMENDKNFQPNIMKDMLSFVKSFDLKTIADTNSNTIN